MGVRFGRPPSVAEGLFLRAWRGGERRGEPRLPPAGGRPLGGGPLAGGAGAVGYRAVFTEAGLAALRRLLAYRRTMLDLNSAELQVLEKRREIEVQPCLWC